MKHWIGLCHAFLTIFISIFLTWQPLLAEKSGFEHILDPGERVIGLGVSAEKLLEQVEKKRASVELFNKIKKIAEKNNIRVWLLGGTAAHFAHYVRWNILLNSGKTEFRRSKFDYHYTQILKSDQDIDLVVDGADSDIDQFEAAVNGAIPGFRIDIVHLKKDRGNRLGLLTKNFLNQNSDSHSIGLIELTISQESVMRSGNDWDKGSDNLFVKEVSNGTITFLEKDLHSSTSRSKEGLNPPIFSVIRYLTKAFSLGLKIPESSYLKISKIVAEFSLSQLTTQYAQNWFALNIQKMVTRSLDHQRSFDFIKFIGLHRFIKETLPEFNLIDRAPLASGKTNSLGTRELDVTHDTHTFAAYESMTASPTFRPNLLISRSGHAGETAAHGDGFYVQEKASTGYWGTPHSLELSLNLRTNPSPKQNDSIYVATSTEHLRLKDVNDTAYRINFFHQSQIFHAGSNAALNNRLARVQRIYRRLLLGSAATIVTVFLGVNQYINYKQNNENLLYHAIHKIETVKASRNLTADQKARLEKIKNLSPTVWKSSAEANEVIPTDDLDLIKSVKIKSADEFKYFVPLMIEALNEKSNFAALIYNKYIFKTLTENSWDGKRIELLNEFLPLARKFFIKNGINLFEYLVTPNIQKLDSSVLRLLGVFAPSVNEVMLVHEELLERVKSFSEFKEATAILVDSPSAGYISAISEFRLKNLNKINPSVTVSDILSLKLNHFDLTIALHEKAFDHSKSPKDFILSAQPLWQPGSNQYIASLSDLIIKKLDQFMKLNPSVVEIKEYLRLCGSIPTPSFIQLQSKAASFAKNKNDWLKLFEPLWSNSSAEYIYGLKIEAIKLLPEVDKKFQFEGDECWALYSTTFNIADLMPLHEFSAKKSRTVADFKNALVPRVSDPSNAYIVELDNLRLNLIESTLNFSWTIDDLRDQYLNPSDLNRAIKFHQAMLKHAKTQDDFEEVYYPLVTNPTDQYVAQLLELRLNSMNLYIRTKIDLQRAIRIFRKISNDEFRLKIKRAFWKEFNATSPSEKDKQELRRLIENDKEFKSIVTEGSKPVAIHFQCPQILAGLNHT